MLADLAVLRERVLAAARSTDVGTQVADVTLEPAQDDDGADFLRVIVQVTDVEKGGDEAFEALLERIEGAVAELDERYPSVRFADAA
jgi:hypothetical protein